MKHRYWPLCCVVWIILLISGNAIDALPVQAQGTMCNMQAAARLLESDYSWNGECQKDLPHGYGIATFADGRLFAGTMEAGLFSGSGTIVLKSGDRYTGSFANGKFQGQGVYSFVTGDRYVGEFVEGEMHGTGVYRPAGSNDRYQVEYVQGKQISFVLEVQAASLLGEPIMKGLSPTMLSRVAIVDAYIRRSLGLKPTYTSGLRDVTQNNAVGGELHSKHLLGRAVDLVVSGITPVQEALVITFANQQGLGALWHGTGENYHLHLQLEAD